MTPGMVLLNRMERNFKVLEVVSSPGEIRSIPLIEYVASFVIP